MAILLSEADVLDTLTMETTIDSVAEGFRQQATARVPKRIQLKELEGGGEMFVMPGLLGASDDLGVKVVNIFPENDEKGLPRTLGTITLYDGETGALRAVMDGTHITNYRTGAIGAVGARYLAPPGADTLAIFGSSTQARYQALALDAELDLETIRIFSRSEMRHEAVEFLADRVDAAVEGTDGPEAAYEGADVLVAATTASSPVFPDEAVTDGMLVIGVGSNDPSMRELPGGAFERADRVFVDDYDLCLGVGDIADTIAEGRLDESGIETLSDLAVGAVDGRQSPDETFVVKSVGTVALDIHVATTVLDAARDQGEVTTFPLQGVESE